MASVSQLGYLGIGTSDAKAWQDLATSILGLQVVPGDDPSIAYLRMDEYHHRLELRANGKDDIEFVGWEVPDPATLHRVARQLEDGGAQVTPGTRAEADNRRVVDLVKCVDPDGIPTEVFYGRPINPQPFHPARPMSGFKTGDMGLGHIVVYARSLDATIRFYRDLLGFRVSDFTEVRTPGGTIRLAFLHCNPRHHSIALEADAHHLMTDVWTSAGVLAGIGVVALTGWDRLAETRTYVRAVLRNRDLYRALYQPAAR